MATKKKSEQPEEEQKEAKPKATKKKTATKKKKSSKPKKVVAKETKADPAPEPKSAPEPKPTIQFVEKPAPKKSSSGGGTLAITIAFLILVGLVGAAWFYQTQQFSKVNKEATTGLRQEVQNEVSDIRQRLQSLTEQLAQEEEQEKDKTKSYSSAGISFTYPAELGDVEEEAYIPPLEVDDPESDEAIRTLMITFTKNADIWIKLTGHVRKQGGDIQFEMYRGQVEDIQAECGNPLDITIEGYCDHVLVAGQETGTFVSSLEDGEVLLMSTPLNHPSDFYGGVSINLNLGQPPVASRNIFAPSKDQSDEDTLIEFFRSLVKKEGLSLIVKQNLESYQSILDSFKIGE